MKKNMINTIHRLINATQYSLAGLAAAIRNEWAFRAELLATIVIIPLALWLGHSAVEQVLLLSSWVFVLIVELMNSALESAVDRISREQHALSKRAKDLGSAAVFIAIVQAVVVWLIVIFFSSYSAIMRSL